MVRTLSGYFYFYPYKFFLQFYVISSLSLPYRCHPKTKCRFNLKFAHHLQSFVQVGLNQAYMFKRPGKTTSRLSATLRQLFITIKR